VRYLISVMMQKSKPAKNDIGRAFKRIIPSNPEINFPSDSFASFQTLEIKNESQEPS
jgi:hypothetical protein